MTNIEKQQQIAIAKLSSHSDMKKLFRLASAVYRLTKTDIYLVWWSVRDILLGLPLTDADITWSISADELLTVMWVENDKNLLKHKCKNPKKRWVYKWEVVQEALGIVNFYIQWARVGWFGNQAQYAQFRIERQYNAKRTPGDVVLWVSLEEDAERRDCSINAIYYNIRTKQFIDPQNGIIDLYNGRIETELKEDVFQNDPLRIFRLTRMKSLLETRFQEIENRYKQERENNNKYQGDNIYVGHSEEIETLHNIFEECNPERRAYIEEGLLNVLKRDSTLIKQLPQARINQELLKGAKYKGYIRLLEEYRILDAMHENFALARWLSQNTPFHKYDTLEHILKVVEAGYKFFPNENPEFYLALLFHDIGKPTQFNEQRKFEPRTKNFYLAKSLYAHEIVGGKIVRELFEYEDKAVKNFIIGFVERHQDDLFYLSEEEMSTDIERIIEEDWVEIAKLRKKYLPKIEYTVCNLYRYVQNKKDIGDIRDLFYSYLKMHLCDKYGSGRFYEPEREALLWKQNVFLKHLFDFYYINEEIYKYRLSYQQKMAISVHLSEGGIEHDLHRFFFNKLQSQIFVGKIKPHSDTAKHVVAGNVSSLPEDKIFRFYSQLAWNKNIFWRVFDKVRVWDVARFDMVVGDIHERVEEIKSFINTDWLNDFIIKTRFAEGKNNTVFHKLRKDNRGEIEKSLKKKSTWAFLDTEWIIHKTAGNLLPSTENELVVIEFRYFNIYVVFQTSQFNNIIEQIYEINNIFRKNETLY